MSFLLSNQNQMWVNPSKSLVDRALRRWGTFGARADNTSAVTLLLDLPGVPRRASDRVSASQHTANSVSSPYSMILHISETYTEGTFNLFLS